MTKDFEMISHKVANLSTIGAILVACIHYREYVYQGVTRECWFWTWFPGPILKVAVPFFFVFAGYWLAAHAEDKGWWWREPWKRVKTLLIPFFVLNLTWFAMTASSWTLMDFLKALGMVRGEYPALPQLWFVLRLFGLVIVSPFFYFIVKRSAGSAYGLFFVVYVALMCRECYCEHVGDGLLLIRMFKYIVPPVGLAGLILGMTFRLYGIPALGRNCGWIVVSFGYFILLISNLISFSSGYRQFSAIGLFYFGLLLFGFGFWSVIPIDVPWRWLSQSTFACYLLHYPFLKLFSWLLNWCDLGSYSSNVIVILIGVGFSIVMSVVCACVLRRCPWTHMVVLGGR